MTLEERPIEMTIRRMRVEDLAQVVDVDTRSFTLPWTERSFRFELLENPGAFLWVAEASVSPDKRVVVGLLVLWLILDEAHIATLAVDPHFRRLGAARCLLAAALLDAQTRGAVVSYLEVRRSNLAAQQLYQSFGYEVVGKRPRYYKDNGEDALLMTLPQLDPERLRSPGSQQDSGGGS